MKTAAVLVALALAAPLIGGCSASSKAENMYRNATRRHAAALQRSAAAAPREFDAAVRSLREVVAKYPGWERSADVQFMIGEMYVSRGDTANAVAEFTRLYMSFPEKYELCSRAHFAIAQLYEKQGNWPSALKEFKEVTSRYPASFAGLQAPLSVIQHYQRNGMKEEAALACDSAAHDYLNFIEEDPDSKVSVLAQEYLVSVYAGQGKWLEAANALERVARRFPRSMGAPYALYRAAMIHRTRANNIPRALELLQKIVREYPASGVGTDALFGVGSLQALQGDVDGARKTFTGFISQHQKEPALCAQASIAVGKALENKGRWDEALAEYRKAGTAYPDTAESLQAYMLIAQHYRRENRSGDYAAALQDVIDRGSALVKRTGDKKVMLAASDIVAEAWGRQGRWNDGIAALKEVLRKYPRDSETAPLLIRISTIYYQKLKSLDDAERTLVRFGEEFPQHRLAVFAQGFLEKIRAEKGKMGAAPPGSGK